ncbi:dicarboxylate/amino acid:cation symporter [Coriobacteriales bacterium OH1046]|nr:dicarboxylate/amino acid:cation symporter [Coriobacteriales bacterium OH1046]
MPTAPEKKFTYNPTIGIIIAMILGIAAGLLVGKPMGEVKFIGDAFFRLIQMNMILFVVTQIVDAVGGLSGEELSSIGLKTIAAFLISSLLASAWGIACAVIARPGAGLENSELVLNATTDLTATTTTVQDTILGFLPTNAVSAMANGMMVPSIVFSVFLGVAITIYRQHHGGQSKMLDLVRELGDLLLTIIRLVMNVAPIGIFCYVSASIGTLGLEILIPIGKYILVLLVGTLIFTIVWLIVVSVRCELPIGALFKKMIPMTVMAAATISSAVTLPLEMDDAKRKIGLRDKIADLALPLGMPLNSNGSALHMAVTAIFVAQMYGVEFQGGALAYVCVIALMLSLANAVAPGATLISLTMLIPALGLPLEAVAILGGLEYIVAAIRTTLNVNSDVFCALLVAKSEDGIDYDIFYGRKEYQEAA